MSSRAEQKSAARAARLEAEREAESAARRRRTLIRFGAVLAAAAIMVVVAVLVSRSGSDTPPASERVALFDGIPQDGPWLGRPDAPVVVEEYADLQCPFCARFAADQLPGLVRDHVRGGRVRLRLRLLTFLGDDSVVAARTAAAAGMQDRQWQFSEAFYARQGREGSGYVTEDFLRDVAGEAGLDADRLFADRRAAGITQTLTETREAGAANEINSTPTFRVTRGDAFARNVDADGLDAAIDAALGAS